MSFRRRSLQFSIIGILVGLVGCGLIAQVSSGLPLAWIPFVPIFDASIQQLQKRSSALDGRTVYLRGVVKDKVPLVNQQIYRVQDETGTIWVLSNYLTLQSEDEIFLKGKLQFQSIPMAGEERGELYVEERKLLEINGNSVEDSAS